MTKYLLLLFMLFPILSFSKNWYVNIKATTNGNGESWNIPFKYLNSALDSASNGDVILMAQGDYYVNDLWNDSLDQNFCFEINKNVIIKGGYSNQNVNISEVRDIKNYPTRFNGYLGKNEYGDSIYCYKILNIPSGINSTIEGIEINDFKCTDISGQGAIINSGTAYIKNCHFSNNYYYGGGKTTLNNTGVLTCDSCTFLNNSARLEGSRSGLTMPCIENRGGSLEVTNCLFEHNIGCWSCAFGQGGSNIFKDCTFTENYSNSYGGALEIQMFGDLAGTAKNDIINCTFTNNVAKISGGAIRIAMGMNSRVINCLFINNKSHQNGGAIDYETAYNGSWCGFGTEFLTNCTFYKNEAIGQGGSVLCMSRGRVNMINSIFYDNSDNIMSNDPTGDDMAVITNCFIDDKICSGEAGVQIINIKDSVSPEFVNENEGDLRLNETSPLINSGILENTYFFNEYDIAFIMSYTDLAKNNRVQFNKIDLGCYEYNGSLGVSPTADIVYDEMIYSEHNHSDTDYGQEKSAILNKDYNEPIFGKKNINLSNEVLPDSIDWSYRDSYVKNQGSCGACWAFAVTGLMENITNIKDISEQVLISCTDNNGCNGGSNYNTLKYIKQYGVPSEDTYGFLEANGSCEEKSVPDFLVSFEDSIYNYGNETDENTAILLKSLLQDGPVIVSMNTDRTLKNYSGGIYDYSLESEPNGVRHSVLLVGYNEKQKYFKVKNSWGTNWGEMGYFRIAYNDVTDKIKFGMSPYQIKNPIIKSNKFKIVNSGTSSLQINSFQIEKAWLKLIGLPNEIAIADTGYIDFKIEYDEIKNYPDTATVLLQTNCINENIFLKLIIKQPLHSSENISICSGSNYQGWTEEGIYERTLVALNGTDSIIATNLTVNTSPEPYFFVEEDTLNCPDFYEHYQWFDENGIINGADSNYHIIQKSGSYYLQVTDSNECNAYTDTISLFKTNIGNLLDEHFEFDIIPNPSNGIFKLRINEFDLDHLKIQVFNKLGQIKLTKEIFTKGMPCEEELDLSFLPNGSYFIKLSDSDMITTRKAIILHH